MARRATWIVAVLVLLLAAGCSGTFGQSGLSLPSPADGMQTVSDAADALVPHRIPASEDAKSAIAATDALGSAIREVSDNERFLSQEGTREGGGLQIQLRDGFARNSTRLTEPAGRRIFSTAQLVVRPNAGTVSPFCEAFAGYSVAGIPSLDETFGWDGGVFDGGTRMTDGGHHFATWTAVASGVAVEAPIGALQVFHSGVTGCPMMTPAFALQGATASNAFSIPFTLTYRRASLWNVSVYDAGFSGGQRLNVETTLEPRPIVTGIITKGSAELATLHTGVSGNGTLTITSSGAQYVVKNWIVIGT